MTNRRNLFRAAGALAGAAFIPASPKHPSGMNGVRTLKGGRIKPKNKENLTRSVKQSSKC